MPRKLGRATVHDEMPPENESHVPDASRKWSKKSATAIVRIARKRPDNRRAGIPTSTPTPSEQITPRTSAGQKLHPWPPANDQTGKAPVAENDDVTNDKCQPYTKDMTR